MKRRDFLKALAGAALVPVVGTAEAKRPNFIMATGHRDFLHAEIDARRFMVRPATFIDGKRVRPVQFPTGEEITAGDITNGRVVSLQYDQDNDAFVLLDED